MPLSVRPTSGVGHRGLVVIHRLRRASRSRARTYSGALRHPPSMQPCGPERRTHADDEDHDANQAGRRLTSSTLGRRGDPMMWFPAVLRAQPRTGALAVLSPVLPSPRRCPSTAHVAAATLPPVSRPGAVPPRRHVGLDAPNAAAPIGRRAIAVRRHQPATPDARNISTTGHGSLLSSGFLFGGNQGEGRVRP